MGDDASGSANNSSVLALFAACSMVIFAESIMSMLSLYLLEYVRTFNVSLAEAAAAGSIFSGVVLLGAIPTGFLIQRLGVRITGYIGGLCMVAGILSTAFAPNISVMYVTYGLVAGFGVSVCYTTAVYIPSVYCTRYHAAATCTVMCACNAADVLFPPLQRWLIDMYGWRGAHIIHSAILLHTIACAQCILPNANSHCAESQEHAAQSNNSNVQDTHVDASDETNQLSSTEDVMDSHLTLWDRTKRYLQLGLFTNGYFIVFNVAYVIESFMDEIGYQFLYANALSKGSSPIQATMLMTYLGISLLISRAVLSFILTLNCLNPIILNGFCILFTSILVTALSWSMNYSGLVVLSVLLGIGYSGIYGIAYHVLSLIVESEEQQLMALAWNSAIVSIGYFASLPTGGYLHDITGSYEVTYYFAGGCGMIAASLIFIIACMRHRRQIKDKNVVMEIQENDVAVTV